MGRYVVENGEARELDPRELPAISHYGTDWIIVDASDPSKAIQQAILYDGRAHPAQVKMEMFTEVVHGLYNDDEDAARAWLLA